VIKNVSLTQGARLAVIMKHGLKAVITRISKAFTKIVLPKLAETIME
jgi:hypothetical protein